MQIVMKSPVRESGGGASNSYPPLETPTQL